MTTILFTNSLQSLFKWSSGGLPAFINRNFIHTCQSSRFQRETPDMEGLLARYVCNQSHSKWTFQGVFVILILSNTINNAIHCLSGKLCLPTRTTVRNIQRSEGNLPICHLPMLTGMWITSYFPISPFSRYRYLQLRDLNVRGKGKTRWKNLRTIDTWERKDWPSLEKITPPAIRCVRTMWTNETVWRTRSIERNYCCPAWNVFG